MSVINLPPTNELFPLKELVTRHPHLLNESRLKWALRNRSDNGLNAVGAVFETRGGELMIREPTFLAWFLGLSGRAKPRSSYGVRSKRSGNQSHETIHSAEVSQ